MTRRRKWLLWGIPAVLATAVVAATLYLYLSPPPHCEAERRAGLIRHGMPFPEAASLVQDGASPGVLSRTGKISIYDGNRVQAAQIARWDYPDGSRIMIRYEDEVVK